MQTVFLEFFILFIKKSGIAKRFFAPTFFLCVLFGSISLAASVHITIEKEEFFGYTVLQDRISWDLPEGLKNIDVEYFDVYKIDGESVMLIDTIFIDEPLVSFHSHYGHTYVVVAHLKNNAALVLNEKNH